MTLRITPLGADGRPSDDVPTAHGKRTIGLPRAPAQQFPLQVARNGAKIGAVVLEGKKTSRAYGCFFPSGLHLSNHIGDFRRERLLARTNTPSPLPMR